jgi:hypothetical protein
MPMCVVLEKVFRRVLPGAAASALGDGMSAVAGSPSGGSFLAASADLHVAWVGSPNDEGTSRAVHSVPRGFVQRFPSS